MPSAATYSSTASGRGVLIAVAGVSPRSGVTTTTVALAHSWRRDPAVVVEAGPDGGQIAEPAGADPYQGLASLARTARDSGAVPELTEHMQFLTEAVALLAAPPGPSDARAAWTTTLLTGTTDDLRASNCPDWRDSDVTIVADLGAVEPDSPTAPILDRADACLIVVHAGHDDPVHARRRVLALTAHSHRRAVLLLASGGDPAEYLGALGLPVLARLPDDRRSARALGHGTIPRSRRGRLLPAVRAVATTIEAQLHPPPAPASSTPDTVTEYAPPTPRPRHHRPGKVPTVYRIDPPASTPPPPAKAEPSPVPRRMSRPGCAPTDTRHHSRPDTDSPPPPAPPRARTPDPEPEGPADHDTALPASHGSPEPIPPRPGTDRTATGITSRVIEPGDTAGRTVEPEPVTAAGAVPVLSVAVFGPLRVWWRPDPQSAPVEVTRSLRRREQDLLIVLALHPQGATREAVIEALWDEHNQPRRPANALNTVVSRLRAAITTATSGAVTEILLLEHDKSRYRLHPELWDCDYRRFEAAVSALRATAAGTGERERACRAVLAAAQGGVLGEDFTGDWIAPIREHARRDRLTALGKLAALLVESDPDQTLTLLETALVTDPTNEPIYQDILRLHARLDERTAINPTLALLKRQLESIGDLPTQTTLDIARILRDRHTGTPDTGPGGHRTNPRTGKGRTP